jgi:hypothetical protein
MWAAYASDHQGLCLVFDRDRLVERFRRTFEKAGTLICDHVRYSDDDPLGTKAFIVDAAEVHRLGVDDVLSGHARQHARDLFLTKLTDWASENEFRLLLQGADDEPAHFEFGDALVGVCIGHRWNREDDDRLAWLCRDAGVGVSKVWWRNGHPDITPYVTHDDER